MSEDWKELLPEDIRTWDEVKNADDPNKFWDQIKNMRSRLGRSLTLPPEDAGEEARKEFIEKVRKHVPDLIPMPKDPESFDEVLKALGKPEDPEKYKLPELEVPEGVQLNEDKIELMRKLAYEAGLTQRQFEALSKKYIETELQQYMALTEAEQQKLSALKQEWGAAFDEKLQKAEAVRKQYFPFLQGNLSADMIKSLVDLADNMGKEPESLKETQKTQALTPDEAELQLSAIFNNKEHPYWNPSDPSHKVARQRVRQLLAYKLGETPQSS